MSSLFKNEIIQKRNRSSSLPSIEIPNRLRRLSISKLVKQHSLAEHEDPKSELGSRNDLTVEKASDFVQLAQIHTHIDPLSIWEEKPYYKRDYLVREDNEQIRERLYIKKNNNLLAMCKIIKKFEPENFDGYLFKKGILSQANLKFDDLMTEIDILRKCNHENIIEFYDAYYHDSTLWVFTEYCSNGSIERLMSDLERPLTETQIHYVVCHVLKGLNYLHEKLKIAHRDIKAANLLISENIYLVKLANFELSAQFSKENGKEKDYLFVNSPQWLAPEIAKLGSGLLKENDYKNTKSDIWSVGITLIEMAERYPPLNDLPHDAVIEEISNATRPPGLKEHKKWSPDFVHFVNICFYKKIEHRPSANYLLHHPFILNTKSDKKEIESLLIERKANHNSTAKKEIEDLQEKIKQIELIREEPKFYLKNHFVDLKNKINECADKVKKRVEFEHSELLKKLETYEQESLKSFKIPNDLDRQVFDDLKKQVDDNLTKWNATNVIDTATEIEVKNLNEIADSNLFSLKSDIFANHQYVFSTSDTENATYLGNLIIEDCASKKQSRRNSLGMNRDNTLLTDKLSKKVIRLRLTSTTSNSFGSYNNLDSL